MLLMSNKGLKIKFYIASVFSTLVLMPLLSLAQLRLELTNFIAFNSIEELLVGILNVFIIIATPIIVFFIIYAGFLYVTAQGNAQQVEQATRALTYAIIGGVIVLGAVAVSEIISNVVDEFRTPPS